MINHSLPPQAVLSHYALEHARIQPVLIGNINQTFFLDTHDSKRYVMQRLHSIFPAAIHRDISIVTDWLRDGGICTPRLIPDRDGQLFMIYPEDQSVWRLQTYVAGHVPITVSAKEQVQTAARLVARFHAVVSDKRHTFASNRASMIHHTENHLDKLRRLVQTHQHVPQFHRIEPLLYSILEYAEKFQFPQPLPQRIVHGDFKISNFVFDSHHCAIAILDFDTLGEMPWPLELGDAFRSWCNISGEEQTEAAFSVDYLQAAWENYKSIAGHIWTAEERDALPNAIQQIILELGTRFITDAIEENYFGWDKVRYTAAWQHQLQRATVQWLLLRSFDAQKKEICSILG